MPRAPRRKPRKQKKLTFKNIRKRVARFFGWPWIRPSRWHFRDVVKFGFLSAFWGGLALVATIFILSMGLPDIRQAVDMDHRPTVILRDRNGKEFSKLGDIQGEILKVNQMSPHIVRAVLAIEDRRFYKHFGVDPIGLARAIYTNARSGGVVQGGSTITQQLAKNLFLTPERTMMRKAKEALLALYLERRYTKDEILAAYLNRAYFGAGAYGVDSAAQVYFNSSARNLTLEQGAMLAGLLKAPSRYSPDNDPKLTQARTRIVLSAMVHAGFLRKGAEKMPLKALPAREYNAGGSMDMRYFADWVMSQVEGYIGTTTQNLVIETTLDSHLQNFASNQMRKIMDEQGDKLNATQAASITMQPNGAVVAMLGGRDYAHSQYNRAIVSQRQPGSSFKSFIYLTALENGYTPQTNVLDAPIKIGKYAPENYDKKYRGNITLQDAVALSLNTVAIRTLNDVGVAKVKRMAQRLGITDPLTNDLSLALGASEVRLLPLTAAYATLSNRGLSVEPYGIKRILSVNGKVLYQRREVPPTAVLDINTVAQMNQMLQAVIIYGTGQRAMLDRPAAGKTGTSSNYRDALFLGYTADYITGVWVGNDNNTPMKKVTGGNLPAQIWHDIMAAAHLGVPVKALAVYAAEPNFAPMPSYDDNSNADGNPHAPRNSNGDSMFDRLLNNILGEPQPIPQAVPQPVAPNEIPSDETIQWDNE